MSDIRGIAGLITGAYRIAAITGLTTGMGANAPIFALRWGSTTQRAMIQTIKVMAALVTPFTAANEISADAIIARSFTVADTGGTTMTLTGSNNVMWSQNHGASLVSDMRVATTGTLTAGTRTLDSQPILSLIGAQTLAAASAGAQALVNSAEPMAVRHSLILSTNEGLIVRSNAAQGAGGTVRFSVELEWLEFIPASG